MNNIKHILFTLGSGLVLFTLFTASCSQDSSTELSGEGINQPCVSSQDCIDAFGHAAYVCASGFCQFNCVNASECPDGYECNGGYCAAGATGEPDNGATCQSRCDCGPGQLCTNSSCVASNAGPGDTCLTNEDCPTGQDSCGALLCVDDGSQKTCKVAVCQNDSDCAGQFGCTNPAEPCVCDANLQCVQGNAASGCVSNSDCENDEYCDFSAGSPGVCLSNASSCTSSAQCPGDQVCNLTTNTCVPPGGDTQTGPSGGSCSTDFDCNRGDCATGQCEYCDNPTSEQDAGTCRSGCASNTQCDVSANLLCDSASNTCVQSDTPIDQNTGVCDTNSGTMGIGDTCFTCEDCQAGLGCDVLGGSVCKQKCDLLTCGLLGDTGGVPLPIPGLGGGGECCPAGQTCGFGTDIGDIGGGGGFEDLLVGFCNDAAAGAP